MNETTVDIERTGPCPGVMAALVEGIARVSDRDPMDLDVCIGDHVDLEAVEALFDRPGRSSDLELRLTIAEYEAVVRGDDTVHVRERTADVTDPVRGVSV